jgi:hypothetical protein
MIVELTMTHHRLFVPHYHVLSVGANDYKRITSFSIEARTDRESVRKVCFIVKQKGGKVR